MSIKRIPKLIDCDRIWADLVTVLYWVLRKPRVTPYPPPLPAEVSLHRQKRLDTASNGRAAEQGTGGDAQR